MLQVTTMRTGLSKSWGCAAIAAPDTPRSMAWVAGDKEHVTRSRAQQRGQRREADARGWDLTAAAIVMAGQWAGWQS